MVIGIGAVSWLAVQLHYSSAQFHDKDYPGKTVSLIGINNRDFLLILHIYTTLTSVTYIDPRLPYICISMCYFLLLCGKR